MKNKSLPQAKEETLDPANWDDLRKIAGMMMDDMLDFQQTIGRQPVWRKPTQIAKDNLKQALPQSPQNLDSVYQEFKENILPYYLGNIHPRYWSWVMGTGSAQGMLAEMLAAAMNCNVGIGDQAPMYVDQQVINWCKQMMEFPEGSSGALVSGASVANLNALIVARNSMDDKIRKEGLPSRKMVLYASTETHSCIQKAAETMGIGSEGVRKVKVNDAYEMDIPHLEKLIKEDIDNGNLPFCVVANVGTVNTGAIDPLDKIFWVCAKHDLWLHIDGAFGALLNLLPEYKEQLQWMKYADSMAFDLHKWMYMPYEAGVVLVKEATQHRAAFALEPDYISHHQRGIAAGPELISNFGLDLSRDFKALKVWMLLKENGIDKFIRLIRQNLEQAKHLEQLIHSSGELQLMTPVSTNIVCFRYYKNGLSIEELNELNKEILIYLHESGIAAPSYTKLNGNYCLRAAIVNHRSRKEDFEVLVEAVIESGNYLTGKNLHHLSNKKKVI